MALSQNISSYIKKLGHPIKEIRERSLQLLIAKLRLGWQLDDELAGTRELFEMLLAWFDIQQPTLQKEALELLLSTIKTNSGTYIAKEYGIKELLKKLQGIKIKLDSEADEVFNDIIQTLKFLDSVECEENICVPRLDLPSISSSESEYGCRAPQYDKDEQYQTSETTSSRDDSEINENREAKSIRVLLFPWSYLCASDEKTLILVEDALRLLKSTKRCCRFIQDVFIRDFPTEVFLNRPTIVENLIAIVNNNQSTCCNETMHVLLCITRSLRLRLLQLASADLAHVPKKIDKTIIKDEDINLDYDEIVGLVPQTSCVRDDRLLALKQLPAPYYALDFMHTVLSVMAKNIAFRYYDDKGGSVDLDELNMCAVLVDELIGLLLECVDKEFWQTEHNTKTHRDIAHKSCMCMRLLGDLLNKYSSIFNKDSNGWSFRSIWLRLVISAHRLLSWTNNSSLPPTSLLNALIVAQLDPAIYLFYPKLATEIASTIQNSKVAKDQDYKRKHTELVKLFANMDAGVRFMKDKDFCRNSKEVLGLIKKSLPLIELHQSEHFLKDISYILFKKLNNWDLNDKDWDSVKSIVLNLLSHNLEWVRVSFYQKIADAVRNIFSENNNQVVDEKCLTLLCDVGVLTEICCHGISSHSIKIASSSSEIVTIILRGRLLVSERLWWRLLAAILPVMPLLHSYAEHDTQLGKSICKSLELDIADCMGVPRAEVFMGLVRLLFVRCPTVQMDASLSICLLLDDEKYLPPRETIRADVLISAFRRIIADDFNIDRTGSTKSMQETGLLQILDVLKQDLYLDNDNMGLNDEYGPPTPTLEPSLRRSTLQQLSVLMQNQDLHEKFEQCDGIKIIITLLRMSLLIDDYLAFPECALSCVSILNSICYHNRHTLAKVQNLPSLLIRVILVFPANESVVLMASQVLCVIAWGGFLLQELNSERKRVLALPLCVVDRTSMPFPVQSYWDASPNTEHSSLEWLLDDEKYKVAIRVRWAYAWNGSSRILVESTSPPGPLSLRMTDEDLILLQTSCPLFCCTKNLLALQNATSHRQVNEALACLRSYSFLLQLSSVKLSDFAALPWKSTMSRFLNAAPASPKDIALLISLLKFIVAYIEQVPHSEEPDLTQWIKSSFLESDNSMILLLSKFNLFPQQTKQETLEVAQLHINIIKVLRHCVLLTENEEKYDASKLESLLKILLVCLGKINLKDFHMLGYLNELVKCIRYLTHCKHSELTPETTESCMREICIVLRIGGASGCKGQACRLDSMITILALMSRVRTLNIPVQRWSDIWSGEVLRGVITCGEGTRAELRAVSLHLLAALALYPQLMPQIVQVIPVASISKYAASIFTRKNEANVVRSAAADLFVAISSRVSSHTEMYEKDILEQLKEHDFLSHCQEILVDFCKGNQHRYFVEPNVPMSMLERYEELEVRASKCNDASVSPKMTFTTGVVPPTPELVIAVANIVHNVVVFNRCPVQAWNAQGLFRLLFRCSYWGEPTLYESACVRESVCRALARSVANKHIRNTLAGTKDCLHSLLCSLYPSDLVQYNRKCQDAIGQGLLLLGSLLVSAKASEHVWCELKEGRAKDFFGLIHKCLRTDNIELKKSTMYCLNQLIKTINGIDESVTTYDISLIEFFDNIKVINGYRKDCCPDYMCEELCGVLINLYITFTTDTINTEFGQDEYWQSISSSLSSLLSISSRARQYAVHCGLHQNLLATLVGIRDHLSFVGKPTQVIKNANSYPTLATLHCTLTAIDCMMINCSEAKEGFADNNISNSLNRLWPWCMMNEPLREAVVHLLHTFTNSCPKGWSAMCSCISSRCLITELCTLVVREASLQSRPHCPDLLVLALNTLTQCMPHSHARPLILKSEVLTCIYKITVSERSRMGPASVAWARLAARVASYADGAAKVLAMKPLPASIIILPAVANAAHHHRITILSTPELLDMLTAALLNSDTTLVVTAGRAIWALAANNHKAKLALRSAGIPAALSSALERMKHTRSDPSMEEALQLLTYTNTLLRDI